MAKKLRIGLLGAGRIGNLHGTNIQNFIPDAEVVIVADPFMNEKMEEWAKSIGISRCSKDPEDVFSAADVPQGQANTSSARSPSTQKLPRSTRLWRKSRKQASSSRSVLSAASTEATRQSVT